MGNSESSAAKVKTGSKVVEQKMGTAKNTGVLSLKQQKLKTVPRSIADLSAKLRTLDLSFNAIAQLPPEITTLKMLKNLDLQNNKLTALPADLDRLTACTKVTLDGNLIANIVTVPPKLTKISVRNNKLGAVPNCISSHPVIKELDLSGNQLEYLPPEIANMAALTDLVADENSIDCIPEALATLQKLRTVSLKRNRISAKTPSGEQSLPAVFLKGSPMHTLNLHENPLSKKALMEFDGFDAFIERRKKLKDKALEVADMSLCGLD